MNFNSFDTSGHKIEEWNSLCPLNEYRRVHPSQLPSILPTALTNKYYDVFVMASASAGTAFYMVNGNRIDHKASAIDQQPLGIAFYSGKPLSNAWLVQHANHTGRTIPQPSDFREYVSASGLNPPYPFSTMPTKSSGSLLERDLPASQRAAFQLLVNQFQNSKG